MNKTANYQLNQWEPSDKVQHGDFNADNAKIDAALKAQADALAGKAASSAVSELQSSVASLSNALDYKGNCQISTSSYTGTGQYGVDHPNGLFFSRTPLLVIVASEAYHLVMVQGVTGTWADSNGGSGGSVSVTWDRTNVYWYGSYLAGQMNESGKIYKVVAFFMA